MLHCTHRNPAVPDFFDSEFMIRDSVVHEADSARFLLGEEITAVSVVKGRPTGSAPVGVSDPMLVLFEAESGALVTIEIFVRTGHRLRGPHRGRRRARLGRDRPRPERA